MNADIIEKYHSCEDQIKFTALAFLRDRVLAEEVVKEVKKRIEVSQAELNGCKDKELLLAVMVSEVSIDKIAEEIISRTSLGEANGYS